MDDFYRSTPRNVPFIDTSSVLLAIRVGARTGGDLADVFEVDAHDHEKVALLWGAVGDLIALKDVRWADSTDGSGMSVLLLRGERRAPYDNNRRFFQTPDSEV